MPLHGGEESAPRNLRQILLMVIRQALSTEIEWVNQRYREVDFVPSHFDKEIIAVAEVDGERAGLGRLIRIDDKNLELGGMYVFDQFRGRGLAKEIVEFLLFYARPDERIFCIPFTSLLSFYQSFGFHSVKEEPVPKAVQEKYLWCKEKYPVGTALLVI